MTAEKELIQIITEEENVKKGIELLISLTSKENRINPKKIEEMENLWSSFINKFIHKGEYVKTYEISKRMVDHLKSLEKKDKERYHKGLGYQDCGVSLYELAIVQFLNAFVEDVIFNKNPYPLKFSRQHLEGLFKANTDELKKLGEYTLKLFKSNELIKSEKVIEEFIKSNGELGLELWRIEYQISLVENELRNCIDKILSVVDANWMDNPSILKKDIRKKVIDNMRRERAYLDKNSGSDIDYFLPQHYLIIVDDNQDKFKDIFYNIEEFRYDMNILIQIRHKTAHFRKLDKDDLEKFKVSKKRLEENLKKCTNLDILPSQYIEINQHTTSGNAYFSFIGPESLICFDESAYLD